MNIYEEIKKFIREQNYKGGITEKGSTAEQNFKRLNKAVNIFEQNGITNPTEADFENILRPAIAAKGKKAGEQAQEKTIRRTLNLAREFYQNSKLKGDFQMNDNEFTNNNEQNKQADFSPEASTATAENNASEISEAKPEQENEAQTKKAVGRPKTGRTEKLTLYTTAETLEELNMLIAEYGTNITELLNKLIDDYLATQSKQIAWLKERKQEFNQLFVK